MHGRIYNFRDVTDTTITVTDTTTLTDFFEEDGRGIFSVEEIDQNKFEKEMQREIADFFNPVLEGTVLEHLLCGKCFVRIPTTFFRIYIEKEIEKFKTKTTDLNLQVELGKEDNGYETSITLGDIYDNLIVNEDEEPESFYRWALKQLKRATYWNKNFMDYEVIQIFDIK